jgi:hypothetical protein
MQSLFTTSLRHAQRCPLVAVVVVVADGSADYSHVVSCVALFHIRRCRDRLCPRCTSRSSRLLAVTGASGISPITAPAAASHEVLQVDVVSRVRKGCRAAGLYAAETGMGPSAGVARTASGTQTAECAIENGREERPESRQTGGEDTEAELQHVPDVEPVLEPLVGHVGKFDLQAGFEDSGDAGEEAEREDDDQGGFGASIDLQFENDGDREDGEEDIGRDVDN